MNFVLIHDFFRCRSALNSVGWSVGRLVVAGLLVMPRQDMKCNFVSSVNSHTAFSFISQSILPFDKILVIRIILWPLSLG